MARIGFIGLGVMGKPMAGHLLRRFGGLTVWNRTAAKAAELVAQGGVAAATPGELAASCDIICLCVSDTPDVEAIVFGDHGVCTSLKRGSLVVDFSTISASATEHFSRRIAEKGASWIDAPLSGGDVGARHATLTIMAGGSAADFERATPIFETVGRKAVHMGPVGSGQRTKMANQIAVVGTLASMSEALLFARQSGMDVEKVIDVVGSGAGGSWSLANYGPRVVQGDFKPGFAAALMAKDLRLVLEALANLDGDYATTQRMTALFEKMVADGNGGSGVHAVAREIGWPVE